MERIEKLERLIPKLKSNKKINPLKIDAMEWELRALRAEKQLKILNIPVVVGRSEQLKCFIDAEPKICHNPNKNYKDCKDCQHW